MGKKVSNLSGVISGINKIARIVGGTMGWGGRNVIFGLGNGVVATKDGATVVLNTTFEDPFEEAGRQLVRDACWRVANTAGDGTTMTAVLSGAFVSMRPRIFGGVTRKDIERWDRRVERVVQNIREWSEGVGDRLDDVCLVSANYDKRIAHMATAILKEVGVDGMVSVERVSGDHMSYEIKRGYRWSRGLVRGEFLGGSKKMILENPLVVCINHVVKDVKELQKMMEQYDRNAGRDLLLIVDDMQGGALSTMIASNGRGFKVAVVHAPEYGNERMEMLGDLSSLCGFEVYDIMSGRPISKFDGKFGVAERVEVSMDSVLVVTGRRLVGVEEEIREELKTADDTRRKFLEIRLSSLVAKLALIKVGSNLNTELSRLTDVIDDCIKAGKSAIRGGIVPGGGVLLANLSYEWDDEFGVALRAPIETIYANAEKRWIAHGGEGIDLRTGDRVDMIEAGVIDCADVVVAAVENAWSVAKLVLTSKNSVV